MRARRRTSFCTLLFLGVFCFLSPRVEAQKAARDDAKREEWPDASEIKRLFNTGPDSPGERHIRSAFAAKEAGNDRLAIREWSEVLRLQPSYSGAYYYRAQAYERLDLIEKAVADLNIFLQRNPKAAAGFAKRGIIYAERGEFERGLRDCNRALALDPKYAMGYALRGDVYRLKGEYRRALEDADTALRLRPGLARAHQVRGRTYHELKDYRQAIRAYADAMRLDPKWPNPVLARGEARNAMGEYGAALADYRRAVVLGPQSPGAHNQLAWFLATCPEAKWRDGKTAVAEATRACSLSQWKDAGNIDSLAAALAEQGDFAGAAEREEEALRKAPAESRKSYAIHLASFRKKQPWREPR
ncbi:MAG: tetratricopeptide repeat protein [Chthoniobacterales bacterium]